MISGEIFPSAIALIGVLQGNLVPVHLVLAQKFGGMLLPGRW
jgi:hypothetical protein